MIDAGLDKLPRLFRLYEDAQNDLKRIQGLFVDQKELLAIYEPGIRKLVSCIAEEIRLVMTEIIISEQVDVWVNLEGPNIDGTRIPIGLLGRFLEKLSVSNKHAVNIAENAAHEGRRFHKTITDLAEFSLVSTVSGSVKIGLRKPPISKFLPKQDVIGEPELFIEGMDDVFESARNETNKAMEGLRLLMRAIQSAQDDDELHLLREEVGQKNLLKLPYYAQDVSPAPRGWFDKVVFYGDGLNLSRENGVVADMTTRDLLKSRL
jgi:hypothetical protein